MSRRAFTLVELLVVIAIIGLLSTIAIVSLNSARAQSRNAKRIADIRQLITAFNLGLDAYGTYPSVGVSCISANCTGLWNTFTANATVDTFLTDPNINKPFMTKPATLPLPADPNTYNGIVYNGSFAGGSGYDGTFPAGPVIGYTLDPATSCGPGRIWVQRTYLTECLYNLLK
jgi:prepilin-type N-terminal cleavage/methylation domain-containing protein